MEVWYRLGLLKRLLIGSLIGTLLAVILVRVAGPLLGQSTGLGESAQAASHLWVGVTVLALVPVVGIMLALVHNEVVGPAKALAECVESLAREGDLEAARDRLRRELGPEAAPDGIGGSELDTVARSFHLLLETQGSLRDQAGAIARDDLWSDVLEGRQLRGDQAEAIKKVVDRLRTLSSHAKRVADGDFSMTTDGLREGDLGTSYKRMIEKLKLLIAQLTTASSKIDGSSRGLQSASRDQATSATQQAAAITETMATMEELAASSGHIADIAKNVVKLADESLVSAQVGSQAVTDVGEGMDEIVLTAQRGAQRLLDLGEKSRSIGKVADLITGIAEQSKFLGLNAAIEAARAGEAGRGFAVVAEEVRNLANHVVESTGEIETLIAEIQSEINAAMLASEEGVKRAERGRELTARAVESLDTITSITGRSTDAARQIELATNQQRSASTQVATAVREVAGASEEVAKGAKRVTSLSNELAALAHDLQKVIVTFESAEPLSAGASTQDEEETYDLEALRRG